MISVLILTRDEEVNLPHCLEAVSWCDDIVVLDSGSTDRTLEIAEAAGARIYHRPFDTERNQREYSLSRIEFRHPWVYNPDADEVLLPELREEMRRVVADPNRSEVAYRVRFRNMFMGRWIRRSSLYPVWVMRLFRPDKISFRRQINLEYVADGTVGFLREHFEHHSFRKGLDAWFDKHNRYSRFEAIETLRSLREEKVSIRDLFSRDPVVRRRMVKRISFRLPFRAYFRFVYMYLLRFGFLDGRAGLTYCRMLSIYEAMIALKVKELRHAERTNQTGDSPVDDATGDGPADVAPGSG